MEFTRCTLKKNGNKVVLQGMIHGLPDPLLLWIRSDLRNHIKCGYRVFCEGIETYEDDKEAGNFSEQELKVLECNELIDDIIEKVFKTLGLTYQLSYGFDEEEGIKYPKNSINIDISNIEYIRLLAREMANQDVNCQDLMDMIEKITRELIIKKVAEYVDRMLKGEAIHKEVDDRLKTAEYLKIMGFFKVSEAITIGYRNEVASGNIDKHSNKKRYKKIYVHYGEAHIEGMTNLLVGKGWKLVKTVKIDSENPGLRKRRPKGVSFYKSLLMIDREPFAVKIMV